MSAAELKVVMSLKDEVSSGIKKMSQEMKVSIDSIKQYFVGFAAAVAGVTSAIMGLRSVWDTINLAAQVKQQEEAFRSLTASYKINADELISGLKMASAETINTSNIMKAASLAIFQGISPDKLVQLMEGARAAARVAGEDIEDTFNKIAEAITSMSPRAIAGLGIHYGLVVNLHKAYKDYADSINKTVEGLSEEDMMAALLNATLSQMEDLKERINLEYKTEAEQLQSLQAQWKNVKDFWGDFLLRVYEGISALNNVLASFGSSFMAVFNMIPALINNFLADFSNAISIILEKMAGVANFLKQTGMAKWFSDAAKEVKQWSQEAGDAAEYYEQKIEVWRQTTDESLIDAGNLWMQATGEMDKYTNSVVVNTAATKDNQKAVEATVSLMEGQVEAYKKFMEAREKVIEELTDKINKMVLSEKDYQSWALEEELKEFQDMYGGDGELMQLFSEYYLNRKEEIEKGGRDLAEELDKSKKDVTDWAAFNAQVAADTVNAIREGFAGFFKDVFSGQLNSAKDLWEGFLDAMINAYANALAEMATKKLGFSSEGGSGFGNLFSWIAGLFGGGTTNSSGSGIFFDPAAYFQHGGIVTSPTLAMVGETEPEVIAPVRALLNSRGGGSNTTVIYVNAVDAASFADVVRRNPGAITSVVEGGIRNNSSIRHTIKRFS